MFHKIRRAPTVILCLLLSACGLTSRCAPEPIDEAAFEALYSDPPAPPSAPLKVYHLGHSLVGHDIPAMVEQLAGPGHSYASQLGWGSFLREHWEEDVPVKGFDESNQHPQHRDPREALASGSFDALVLTEAVEIRDAIKYYTPHEYLRNFARAAWDANPEARVYLYETWHPLDDPEGFLKRIDRDLGLYWEGEILRRALAYDEIDQPIYVIPAGQVVARTIREIEAQGGIGPIRDRQDLFSDAIHLSDYGAYLVALTHYAVLYQRSPVGLPHGLTKADGSPAQDPGPEAAALMQRLVWEVVTGYPPSGVATK